jgi:hypothetical protein
MSRCEQGGYLPPFAPHYKRKNAWNRKIFEGMSIQQDNPPNSAFITLKTKAFFEVSEIQLY